MLKKQMEDMGFADASIMLEPGIYVLGLEDKPVWVGRTMALAGRIGDHTHGMRRLGGFVFDSIYFLPIHAVDLAVVESYLILKLNPKYNVISPLDLGTKACMGLVGAYDQAHRRRLDAVMGTLGLNFEELVSGRRQSEDWEDIL